VHALLFLVFVPLLAARSAYLPRVVIGTLVFYAGTQLFDRWTLELVRRIARRKSINWRSIAIDLFVIALVGRGARSPARSSRPCWWACSSR
jgi:MFS superfamily sulfate permease-like transporter